MSARRKKMNERHRALTAADRILGLTPVEEAKRDAEELLEAEPRGADRTYDGTKADMADRSVRWLGFDSFASGDDVWLVVGEKGAVLSCIYGASESDYPSKSIEVKLTPAMLEKLKRIVAEA